MSKSMDLYLVLFFCLCFDFIQTNPLSVNDVGQQARNTKYVVECCICNDFDDIRGNDCSERKCQKDLYSARRHLIAECEYCQYMKQYTGTNWKTKVQCSVQPLCEHDYARTIATPGCFGNGTPSNGTTCNYCCRPPSALSPIDYCINNTLHANDYTKFNRFTGVNQAPALTATTTISTTTTTTASTTNLTTTETSTTPVSSFKVCSVCDSFDGKNCNDTTNLCNGLCQNRLSYDSTGNLIRVLKSCALEIECNVHTQENDIVRCSPFMTNKASPHGIVCTYCCDSKLSSTPCNRNLIPSTHGRRNLNTELTQEYQLAIDAPLRQKRARTFQVECCLCNDFDDIRSNDCSERKCLKDLITSTRHFTGECEYCQYMKQYTGSNWKTKVQCSIQPLCEHDYARTLATQGCFGNGTPTKGTTCYYCCRSPSVLSPIDYCINDTLHKHDYTKFNRFTDVTSVPVLTKATVPSTTPTTTPTTTSTTSTTPTTTTVPTTTKTTRATSTTVTSTVATSTAPPSSSPTQLQEVCSVCDATDGNNCNSATSQCQGKCENRLTFSERGTLTHVTKSCVLDLECRIHVQENDIVRCNPFMLNRTAPTGFVCSYCCDPVVSSIPCNTDLYARSRPTVPSTSSTISSHSTGSPKSMNVSQTRADQLSTDTDSTATTKITTDRGTSQSTGTSSQKLTDSQNTTTTISGQTTLTTLSYASSVTSTNSSTNTSVSHTFLTSQPSSSTNTTVNSTAAMVTVSPSSFSSQNMTGLSTTRSPAVNSTVSLTVALSSSSQNITGLSTTVSPAANITVSLPVAQSSLSQNSSSLTTTVSSAANSTFSLPVAQSSLSQNSSSSTTTRSPAANTTFSLPVALSSSSQNSSSLTTTNISGALTTVSPSMTLFNSSQNSTGSPTDSVSTTRTSDNMTSGTSNNTTGAVTPTTSVPKVNSATRGPSSSWYAKSGDTVCMTCVDTVDNCKDLYSEQVCNEPNNYCINYMRNSVNGEVTVNRTCGNLNRCYREWFQGSSDSDKCQQYRDDRVLTIQFECTYCCITDRCNEKISPDKNTLYNDV